MLLIAGIFWEEPEEGHKHTKRRGSQKSVFGLTHPVLLSAAILKDKHYICG